eukprot:m.30742 g.30742  ORF g.30742 m.30742 type:complete len:655 (-) comp10636_c2_seq2:131-2095(-)
MGVHLTASSALLVLVLLSCVCGQDYQSLVVGKWTQSHMRVGDTLFFSFSNSNPGKVCEGPCEAGNRWVQVAAHSQALPVRLTVSVSQPLLPEGICNATAALNCVSTQQPNAAIVSRLGQWTDVPEDGCYIQGSEWVPFSTNTIYVAVSLVGVSTASLQIATIGLYAELGSGYRPMPGGCASTSDLYYDSMLSVQYSRETTTISYQQADFGSPQPPNFPARLDDFACTCDYLESQAEKTPGTLRYELFRAYLSNCGSDYRRPLSENDVLLALSHMSTVTGVKSFGVKVDDTSILPTHVKDKSIDSVVGQGVIYNVLVTDVYRASLYPDEPIETFQSVYAPSHTYACSMLDEPDSISCHHIMSIFYLAVCLGLGLIGLFLALFGLRFYVASMVIFFGLTIATVSYILLENFVPVLSYEATMGISIAAGAVLAFPVLLLWHCTNWNGLFIVFQGSVAGFLLAAFAFATPLGEMPLFMNPFNYGMTFACICVLMPVLLLVKGRTIAIFSTSFVGSYCVLYAIDFFIGSGFDDIVLNVIERSTNKHFATSYTGNYFGSDFNGCSNLDKNTAFLASWIAATVVFCAIQYVVTGAESSTVDGEEISFKPGSKREQGREYERQPLLAQQQRLQQRRQYQYSTARGNVQQGISARSSSLTQPI